MCQCVWSRLWEFVACAAVLSLLLPFCGIPALVFAVRSQVSYRQGDINASRAANLTSLRLITAAGVCLCALAVTASVLIAVFSYDARVPAFPSTPTDASSAHAAGSSSSRQQDMFISSNAFEKALQRHDQEALRNRPRTTNSIPRRSGGLGTLIRNAGRARFSGRRSGISTSTAKPRFESGLMRRLRTWNVRNPKRTGNVTTHNFLSGR